MKNLGNPNSGLKYQAKDGPFKVFKTPISDRSMSLGKIESAERINKTMIAYANTLSVEFVEIKSMREDDRFISNTGRLIN